MSGPSGGGSLKLSWGWSGLDNQDDLSGESDAPGATAVEAIKADLKRVAVAYQNAIVKIFDIESGKEVSRLSSDISYGRYCSCPGFHSLSDVLSFQMAHQRLRLTASCRIQQCHSL